jgi:hypothetical protein
MRIRCRLQPEASEPGRRPADLPPDAEKQRCPLICDFGNRLGHYRQASLAVDIAQLQTESTKLPSPSIRSCGWYPPSD